MEVYIYRRVGERYASFNLIKSVSFGGGSIMLWGGISKEARTVLVEAVGRMTGDLYICKIMFRYVGYIAY